MCDAAVTEGGGGRGGTPDVEKEKRRLTRGEDCGVDQIASEQVGRGVPRLMVQESGGMMEDGNAGDVQAAAEHVDGDGIWGGGGGA